MKLETVRVSDCPRPRPKNNQKKKKIEQEIVKKLFFQLKSFCSTQTDKFAIQFIHSTVETVCVGVRVCVCVARVLKGS